jgi:hypothetical protein
MLSPNELSLLYEIISDEKQTFEKISKKFDSNFNNESKTKATMTLLILLSDNILNIHQRIISYYILYEISKKERRDTNPFLSVILEKLESSTDKNEQNFLIDFLCGQINYSNLSVDKYLNQNPKEQRINITQIKMHWDKYYKEILNKKNINTKTDDNRRSVIYDRKNIEKNIDNHPNLDLLQNICNSGDNNFNLNYFKANYMSYYPVNIFSNSFFNKEPVWILPSLKHNFLWEKK